MAPLFLVPCDEQEAITPTLAPALQLFCGFEPTNSPLSFLAYKRVLMTPSLGAAGVVGVEKINCVVASSTVSLRWKELWGSCHYPHYPGLPLTASALLGLASLSLLGTQGAPEVSSAWSRSPSFVAPTLPRGHLAEGFQRRSALLGTWLTYRISFWGVD